MERGNGNTVLLTVIGVATLLVALVGATFAYFTANLTNNSSNITVTTSKLAGMTLTQYQSSTPDPAYPGLKGYVVYEVAADGDANSKATYSLTATFASEGNILGDVKYTVCGYNSGTTRAYADAATVSGASGVNYLAGNATYGNRTVGQEVVNNVYYIANANAALPTNCTSASTNLVDISTETVAQTTPTITLAASTGREITGGTYDYYFIVYEYVDTDTAQTQGQTFTITPSFAALSTVGE